LKEEGIVSPRRSEGEEIGKSGGVGGGEKSPIRITSEKDTRSSDGAVVFRGWKKKRGGEKRKKTWGGFLG